MSTAAPATGAPAPAAPAATPATGVEATPSATPASPQRTIKPIPARLPGVLEDGPEDASAPEAVAARARDARGRFTADGTPIVGKDAKSTPEPTAAEPEIPPAPEVKPKVKFAGREFDSLEAADHWAKSMEGRYKPIQEKATQTEGQLVKAAESARGWHAEAQRLAARVAELEAGGGNLTPPADQAPAAGVDWALYAEIAKVANEAGEPWKAQQWLQEQTDALRARDAETLRQEIARLRDEAIEGPAREAAEQAELAGTADTIVGSLASHKNPDGSPAFPEAADGETMFAVGELWRSMDLDPRLALTAGGSVAAIALYRMARGMDAATPAPSSVVPPPPSVDPAAAAAAGFEGGRPLMPAATPRRELDPSVARLVAGLKSTELLRPGLGFEA